MYRLFGRRYYEAIELDLPLTGNFQDTEKRALELLSSQQRIPLSQRDRAFAIYNMEDLKNSLRENSRTVSNFLVMVAGISLLVGGIGIMNIMLVSLAERTREIGLRKALGARSRDIFLQFLIECVVVSLVGGTLGVLVGWLATVVMASGAGWAVSFSAVSALIAFCVSILVGLAFGIYPAKRASHLKPIEALKFE
jgi:ABC-type antimicrobial peptide transport system permease subunit